MSDIVYLSTMITLGLAITTFGMVVVGLEVRDFLKHDRKIK